MKLRTSAGDVKAVLPSTAGLTERGAQFDGKQAELRHSLISLPHMKKNVLFRRGSAANGSEIHSLETTRPVHPLRGRPGSSVSRSGAGRAKRRSDGPSRGRLAFHGPRFGPRVPTWFPQRPCGACLYGNQPADCKSAIPGSNPGGASFKKPPDCLVIYHVASSFFSWPFSEKRGVSCKLSHKSVPDCSFARL
jgi:hypothetical protein